MAERTAPDVLPISGLAELFTHLDALDADPTTPIQPKLFDDVELQLTEANTTAILPTLLPRLNALLFTITTQNPSPLLSLTTKLLSPIPFQRLLPLTTPDALLLALHSPLPGANLLALSIIHKAAASTDDVRVLAESMAALVGEVVTVWIGRRDTGVAEMAARVLGELLEMDCEIVVKRAGPQAVNGASTSKEAQRTHRLETKGEGRLWKLLFSDPDNLVRIVANCSLTLPAATREALPPGSAPRPEREITISQGRLLRILPRLAALNMSPLLIDHTPLLQPFQAAAAGNNNTSANITPSTNILSWAALEMVDQSDVLMHLTLVDFFETFVSLARVATHQGSEKDEVVKTLLRQALAADGSGELRRALTSLPDRTVEEEAEGLREYLRDVL